MIGPFARLTPIIACPICGNGMFMLNAQDSGLCPVHGEISGMDFIRTKGMPKVDALIEIMAEQAKHEIWLMGCDARALIGSITCRDST